MKKINLIEWLSRNSHEKQKKGGMRRYAAVLMMLLTLGVGQMWGGHGYNGESHVYLNVDGTTKYYEVSHQSWDIGGGVSIPGTWGGVLSSQTFNNVLNIQVVGGAVGGWCENDNISGNLYYKVTNNTTTPSSGWISVGNINANYTSKNGNNCFRYKNNYSVNVTPTTPGTYYLHIKITDGDSNNRTSYVKIVVPSFTVAGSTAVLGSDWDVTDTDNDMTFSSGTSYTLTKSNVDLAASTNYECKVVLNHAWAEGSYPASNEQFSVNTAGRYNVTFTFNASTQAVNVSTTPTTYAITLHDNNGGSHNGSATATYNSTSLSSISAPTRSNYHVEGYYTNAGCSIKVATPAGALQSGIAGYTTGNKWTKASDATLYAKWEGDTWGITWKDQGNVAYSGSNSASLPSSYTYGTGIATLTDGEKTGYTFGGWYTNSTCTEGPVTSISSSATGAKTFYAKWTINNHNIDYTAPTNGSYTIKVGSAAVSEDTNADYGTTIALAATANDGYHFGSWTVTGATPGSTTSASTNFSMPDNDVTVAASFAANTYTVTFNKNGGSGDAMSSESFTYGTSKNLTANTYTRTGYTFQGWATSAGGSKVYNDGAAGHLMVTANGATVELFAVWQANNYTVTLDYDETGYGSAGVGVNTSVSATYGSAMPAMGTAPTPAPGYKFEGYWTGVGGTGTQYYAANGSSVNNWNIAEDTELHAYFKKTTITSLSHPASIANGAEITLDVNPIFNQTGAEDNMDICWSLLYDNDNPVESGVAVASYTEGDTKPKQVRFTLTGLSAGNYQVQAILKAKGSDFTNVCDPDEDDVEELCTIKSNVRIAGNSKVTIQYKDGSGNTLAESRTIEIASGESAGVKAPSMIGYTFSSWTVDPVLTNTCADGASCGTDKDTINISAAYDGFLTANYTKKDMIYFNNTLGWEHVYVYFYDNGDYWDHEANKGIGAQYDYAINNHSPHYYHFWGEMTQIGTSNVYYFDYQAAAATIDPSNAYKINSYTHVAFTKDAQGYTDASHTGYGYFYSTEAAYRTDFAHDKSMYVPLNANTVNKNVDGDNKTVYYNTGYWMNYPENTGYTLKIYDNNSDGALKKEIAFTFPADKKMPMSITTDLEAGKTYGFKIERVDGTSYGNAGTMSNGHSGDGVQTVWEFKSNVSNRCGLTTSSAGDYTFTLSYGLDAVTPTPGYNYLVGVHYPEATGDYRVLYKDDVHTKWKPSSVIPKNLDKDTISYFVRKAKNPVLKLQKCTATYEGGVTTVTWSDTIDNLIPTLPTAITEDGVYYFCINKNEETGKRELGDTKPYEGNFYIRVDGAGYSNWDNFRASDHLMPYSDYSFSQKKDPYSHYFTKWYDCSGGNKNIKFVVANDYSVCISDTLAREALSDEWTHIDDYIDEDGTLKRSANVRFMYNYKTNAVSRAFIDGSYADGGNFLKILAQTKDGIYLVPSGEAGDAQTEITFHDNGNWVYEKTVYAVPGARYKLRSLFGETGGGKNQITQWFKGGAGETAADSATIIGGTGSSRMQIRLLYDFKTNRVVTAYQPSGTIDEDLAIHADIMFMREHQGDVEQITFASGKKITDIENIYCGLRFNKWTLNNRKKDGDNGYLDDLLSRYERDIFYVSFPYDVRLSDVIGFGTYGQHWIVEYYDGAARAKNGFWVDSESYWKFVTPAMKDTFTLKAGTGYIVALDLDELYCFKSGEDVVQASLWAHTAEVELLFPGKVSSISNVNVTYTMPTHTCTINRGTTAGNRTKKDSHWNVLGVPTFKNITGAASGELDEGVGSGELVFANTAWVKDSMKLKFIYDGNLADNSLTAKAVKGFEFKAMHAYVVQYCGNVTFSTSATPAPSPIVARRTYAEKPIDVDFRLELNKNGVMEDQTFVSLSNDENVSADFEFGEDLSKEFNTNRANIYTFIGTEWVAGNTLPMSNQTTIIPVGVKTAVEGEYTFSIPEGTYGVGITLIDNVAGARVNLGLMDYTVTLGQGQIDNRFLLEISPIVQSPTDVELLNGDIGEKGARKVMIDGLLYIVKDGVIYDAQGKRIQ